MLLLGYYLKTKKLCHVHVEIFTLPGNTILFSGRTEVSLRYFKLSNDTEGKFVSVEVLNFCWLLVMGLCASL